jgi:hypothetical protein
MTTRMWRTNGTDRLATALRIVACVTALAVLLLAIGCGPAAPTPEQQLRQWVAAVESAAEGKARAPIMELVAKAYNDSRGNARDDVDKLLRLYFIRQSRIGLMTAIDRIELSGDQAARMTVTVGMSGAENRTLGINAYRCELELEADGEPQDYSDWQLLSARWGELGAPLR